MPLYRSFMGTMIDIEALVHKNSNTRAVGANMNARGDILGPGGKIVKRIEQIEQEYNETAVDQPQSISIADAANMRRFAQKRNFLQPEEIQEEIKRRELEKNKALKKAESVLTSSEMLSKSEPIINDYTASDNTDVEKKTIKKKMV